MKRIENKGKGPLIRKKLQQKGPAYMEKRPAHMK